MSPQQLLFAYSPRPIVKDELKLTLIDEFCEEHDDKREELRNLADERIKTNQRKQKERCDLKFKSPRVYEVGDPVVVFREPPYSGDSRKLLRKFRGPYTVTKVLYGDRYRVENVEKPDGRRRYKGNRTF